MTDSTAVVPVEAVRVELGVLRADRPAQLVSVATEAANALASVIESRKLYSNIQGKKFVRCEGWTTLAAMLGVTPHEIGVTEVEGAFTATVELRRLTDGQPVSRASAECGPDESTWKSRARYARRSMALTRATAKACRLAFSWIMALSGYEVTPAEEIPQDTERGGVSRTGKVQRVPDAEGPRAPVSVPGSASAPTPPTAAELSKPPLALADDDPVPTATSGPVQLNVPPKWRKVWRWGVLKDRELHTLSSDELVQQAKWARKSGKGLDLVDTMEEILASREGE